MLRQDEVEKVALLARLEFEPQELAILTAQLARIVDYVAQLDELDTEGVEPLAHAADLCNVFAEDALGTSLPREEALANAPKCDQECFRVPAVLGD
jgi:aspartyl-tRNA(Asn)/glutamyl-tRNA(Gln) amidotransferase subunit C